MTRRGFRARLTATIIALVAITAVALSATAYVLVRNSLREQVVDEALARAEFNVVVLADAQQLPADAGLDLFQESGLAARFITRGSEGVYVDFGDDDPFASSPDLLATPDIVSDETQQLVDDGRFGYEFAHLGDRSVVIVGARRPPDGPDFYFYNDASVVDAALDDLWRFLVVGTVVVIVIAVLTAGAVSRGVLRPVRNAGAAAERLAAGDLDARIPVESDDEFGRMSETFNDMASALQQQVTALEEAEARERRFVADVSHELRTPLTSLSIEAQLLEANLHELTGAGRRAGELLVADIARLRHLVDELLEVSRLDADPGTLEPVATDIDRFLRAVVAERHADASVDVLIDVPVAVDRHSLERVVANLLDNARTHAAGSPVAVTASIQHGDLVIHVDDHGPGVTLDTLDHLFDRFYKADPSRQGGSGLGLAIARQHALRMGGDLTAAIRQPTGLRFELRVPVTQRLHDGEGGAISKGDADGAIS